MQLYLLEAYIDIHTHFAAVPAGASGPGAAMGGVVKKEPGIMGGVVGAAGGVNMQGMQGVVSGVQNMQGMQGGIISAPQRK